MKKNKLDIEMINKQARIIVEKSGEHQHRMFVKINGALEMHILAFSNDDEKKYMLNTMRKMVNLRKIDSYVVVFDAWTSIRDPLSSSVRPRDDLNRGEVLIVGQYNSDNTGITIYNKFKRDENNKIVWIEKKVDKNNKTYKTWKFYIEDAIEERIGTVRVKAFLQEEPDFEKKIDNFLDMALKGTFTEEKKLELGKKLKEATLRMVRDGKLVKEKVVKVTSFATKKDFKKHGSEVITQVGRWGRKWKQESVSYENEGDLFIIKPPKKGSPRVMKQVVRRRVTKEKVVRTRRIRKR